MPSQRLLAAPVSSRSAILGCGAGRASNTSLRLTRQLNALLPRHIFPGCSCGIASPQCHILPHVLPCCRCGAWTSATATSRCLRTGTRSWRWRGCPTRTTRSGAEQGFPGPWAACGALPHWVLVSSRPLPLDVLALGSVWGPCARVSVLVSGWCATMWFTRVARVWCFYGLRTVTRQPAVTACMDLRPPAGRSCSHARSAGEGTLVNRPPSCTKHLPVHRYESSVMVLCSPVATAAPARTGWSSTGTWTASSCCWSCPATTPRCGAWRSAPSGTSWSQVGSGCGGGMGYIGFLTSRQLGKCHTLPYPERRSLRRLRGHRWVWDCCG